MNHPDPQFSVASDAADRVRSIVAAAESEAARMRYEAERDAQARHREAEEQATRFLEDAKRRAENLVEERRRRIAEISEQIVESSQALLEHIDNAAAVRRQLDAVVQALGETADRLTRDSGRTPGEIPEPPVPAGDRFDGARLVALQMAVAGTSREEVEAHLRRGFGLEDPHPILDDVFGAAGRLRLRAI